MAIAEGGPCWPAPSFWERGRNTGGHRASPSTGIPPIQILVLGDPRQGHISELPYGPPKSGHVWKEAQEDLYKAKGIAYTLTTGELCGLGRRVCKRSPQQVAKKPLSSVRAPGHLACPDFHLWASRNRRHGPSLNTHSFPPFLPRSADAVHLFSQLAKTTVREKYHPQMEIPETRESLEFKSMLP